MRKAEFYVPKEAMPEFALELSNRRLENSIGGVTEENEIVVEVEYDRDEESEIDELEDFLEEVISKLPKGDEEE